VADHRVGVSVHAVQQAVQVIEDAKTIAIRRLDDFRLLRQSHAVLGLPHGGHVSYRNANVHPLIPQPWQIHPDNLSALEATARLDVQEALRSQTLLVWPEVFGELQDSLVLLGSPTSEDISRAVFGYVPTEGGLRDCPDHLDLRWRWQLDPTRVAGDAARYVPGLGLELRPNWAITDTKGESWEPAVRPEGPPLIDCDFLLVTRLPNPLAEGASEEGRCIVSVGGTHGLATAGIELVLRHPGSLRQLEELRRGTSGWYQALFRVSGITHSKQGSKPGAVELVGVETYDDPLAGGVGEAVAGRLFEWSARVNNSPLPGTPPQPGDQTQRR
jgi:hypothetical protein